MRPNFIEIVGENVRPEAEGGSVWFVEMVESGRLELLCRSSGSHPAAKIAWSWAQTDNDAGFGVDSDKDEEESQISAFQVMQDKRAQQESDSNKSGLILTLNLNRKHHLTALVCTATNEQLPSKQADRSISAKVKLFIKCK